MTQEHSKKNCGRERKKETQKGLTYYPKGNLKGRVTKKGAPKTYLTKGRGTFKKIQS